MIKKPILPTGGISGCRNPYEGELPLKTILRILREKTRDKKKEPPTIRELLKDKVQY